jgi:hypothetical protein
MGIFGNLFGKKDKKEYTIPISELVKDAIPKNATILYQSEIPEWVVIGNLNFEQKYNEAIEYGKKLLTKEPNSAGVHIELMVAYFKLRNENPKYFDLSTYHAKQAIIYGHNTGYAHERLVINLEKNGMINQAIQLCDIVLSEKYHFSSHGCGRKEDFLFRKEKLTYKLHTAKDNVNTKLFSDKEITLLYKNLDVFLEIEGQTSTHPGFTISDEEIEKELKKIRDKENGIAKEYIYPDKPKRYIVSDIPLGVQYDQIIRALPEFDFYKGSTYVLPNRHQNFVTDPKQGQSIWNIQHEFENMIQCASSFEHDNNLKEAAKIYERIIAEKYWLPTPYDRLVKIYSKAKLKLDECQVLEYSINHFTELKKRQQGYVIQLATKYGKLDFAKERINNDKKISYYNGAFELYNPYTIISKWEERLNKIHKYENNKN